MGVVWHSVALALIIAGTALSSACVLSNAPLVTHQVPRDVGALWMMVIVYPASRTRYQFGVLGWCKNTLEERASLCVTKALWKLPEDGANEGVLANLPSSISRSTSDVGICMVIVMAASFGLLGTLLIWATCKQPLRIWPGKPQFFGGLPPNVSQVAFGLNLIILAFSLPNWVYIRRAVNDVRAMDRALDVSYGFGFKTSIGVYLLTSVGLSLWALGGLQTAHKGSNVIEKA